MPDLQNPGSAVPEGQPTGQPQPPAPAGQPGATPPAAQQPPAGQPPLAGTPPAPQADPAAEAARLKSELNDAIGQRQAAKQRTRDLETQLAEVNKKLEKVPSEEDLQRLAEIKAREADDVRTKAIKAGDVEVIEKRAQEPLRKQIEVKDARIDALETQLTSLLRDNALLEAAQDAGAVHPSQVVGLLRNRVKMVDAQGQYVAQFVDEDDRPMFNGNGDRVADPKEFVGLFLSRPENANLVTTQTPPGSGAKPPGGPAQPPSAGIPQTLAEFNAMPEGPAKQAVALGMTEEQRNTMLGVRTEKPEDGFV